MSNFIIFNVLLFIISSIIDYIVIYMFGIIEWSEKYFYYLIFVNIPLSSFLSYKVNKKIKDYL